MLKGLATRSVGCNVSGDLCPRTMRLQQINISTSGMFKQSPTRLMSVKKFFNTKGNPLTPYLAKSYVFLGFAFGMVYVCIYAFDKMMKKDPLIKSEESKRVAQKTSDPRRPPWPLLHQRVVFMREGQITHEDISLLWEQCKYYYPHDWLIPLEIGQILKYTTGDYLQAYVADPDGLRKEVLMQLLNVKYGRFPNPSAHKISREVEEIISIAVEDLEALDLRVGVGAPLVPAQMRDATE